MTIVFDLACQRGAIHIIHLPTNSSASLSFVILSVNSLTMPLPRQPFSKCTSAGRVTARLLLSFLALSAPIAASANDQLRQQQQPIPILAPFPSEPQTRTPQSGEHVFVGWIPFLLQTQGTNYITIRHYGTSSIMATSIDQQYTRGSTSRKAPRQCG